MNKKATKFRETRGNRHPSQNDLPSIDKFHPDYWYYREEMDEPDDIDINYENESKNMNKKLIRLTENDLHRIVKESVNRVINEIHLGNGSIDFDDWHITSLKSNEDGYYEFEARCDNDWYTLRGSYYGNGEIELDFLLSGHSGYGRQIPINKKLQRWFDIYGRKELTDEIEYWIYNNMVEEPNYDEEY